MLLLVAALCHAYRIGRTRNGDDNAVLSSPVLPSTPAIDSRESAYSGKQSGDKGKGVRLVKTLVGKTIPNLTFSCTCDDSFQRVHDAPSGNWTNLTDEELVELDSLNSLLGISESFVPNPLGYFRWNRPGPLQQYRGALPFTRLGFDPVCDKWTTFSSSGPWFRDTYQSASCGSLPRERALAFVLANVLSSFGKLTRLHESSPNQFGLSARLQNILHSAYIGTQYFPTIPCGQHLPQNSTDIAMDLEEQCLSDRSIDVVVTQDVFEHIYDASSAFQEIARTLKERGVHAFTVPTPAKQLATFVAAERKTPNIQLNSPPEVHGNPVEHGGALLTRQWGYDIVDFIERTTGMLTYIIYVESPILGIEHAEYREVFISYKPETGVEDIFDSFLFGQSCEKRSLICTVADL
jgi:SAM-dependent methyltransferase